MEATKAKVETLRAHPFLEGLNTELLELLAGMASEATFRKDEWVFRQGDESSLFYLLLQGLVALEVTMPGKTIRIQTAGPGEELGWSSLVTPVNKQFQARSLQPVRALAFDGARLRTACDANCVLGYELMRRLLRVVAQRLQNTRMQLIDMYSPAAGARQ